ncbi:helix-turn-helix domain-containing protein [Treponema parvum]|uniref:Helix-turn-helix domain-containing protein n=1 Tax=Treponema parvum TaxID=138851 RepID=A0A975EY37_9SPIR|nr:helix-turn-helix transcriptional regulator [Treponema parvum]QTQ11120.1 helix-turn-helix domain-containing protein [Treponema parvum]
MESYGQILKNKREEKKLDIDKIAHDITISRQYLKALEDEDESAFPGEPYLYGFLKSYAEYLGLNPDSVTVLYKNKKIQESDIPEGLLFKRKRYLSLPLILCGLLILLALTGSVVFFTVFRKNINKNTETVAIGEKFQSREYDLTDGGFSKRLYKGDKIIVPSEEGNVILMVAGTLGSLKLDTPAGRQKIDLAEELLIDIAGNAKSELVVYVSDISARDESRGAEVSMILRKTSGEIPSTDVSSVEETKLADAMKVLLSDTRAYPFTINATFHGACVFRSVVDGGEASEAYYTRGEIVTMTPKNGVRLWMSNGNTVHLQMIANGQTTNLDIGKAGKVAVQDIKWIKDTDGLYKVVVSEVD